MEGIAAQGQTIMVIETRLATRFHECRLINPFAPTELQAFYDSLGDDDAPDAEVSACGTKINCASTAIGCATTAVWMLINKLTNGQFADTQPRINTDYQPLIATGSQSLES